MNEAMVHVALLEEDDDGTEHARGIASRYGFELPWEAERPHNAEMWKVTVPGGHSVGDDGDAVYEVIVGDDFPRFARAVDAEIKRMQEGKKKGRKQ